MGIHVTDSNVRLSCGNITIQTHALKVLVTPLRGEQPRTLIVKIVLRLADRVCAIAVAQVLGLSGG